ncbi:mannose-1-phosphate guanylyltransferase [Enemella sp. A6]|uniref:mannose-1-phosphate guanylyltransferase n=1 Tax=Enemella sp. A6 TaxID=3440152 RepID=UPI003EBB3197
MRYAVIVAGGAGTRLWPLSRKGTPKQLLPLIGDRSLLRMAFDRVVDVVGAERVLVCTGAAFADQVAAELPELPARNILGEPVGRDSLNAMAWPTAVLAAQDPEATVAIVTADHIIEPEETFRATLQRAFEVAETQPALVTFGVVPTHPHTGYGYLWQGEVLGESVQRVREFREKPDRETAEAYLASGEYWWNSGMFVWRAEHFLSALATLLPHAHRIVTQLAEQPELLDELFAQLPKVSVDYAVMEPVSHGRTELDMVAVELPISWHDIGGFTSLAGQLPTDEAGNAVDGAAVLLDGTDNLVVNHVGDGHLVAAVGLSGHVVVHTDEITLVCPLDQAERIKELVARVTETAGDHYA